MPFRLEPLLWVDRPYTGRTMQYWSVAAISLLAVFAFLTSVDDRNAADGQSQLVNGRIVLSGQQGFPVGDIEIHTMHPDGTEPQRLTDWPGFDNSPRWSPDGSLIVFAHDVGAARDLWLMDASGTNRGN